jgi:hypothetical protein
MNSSQIKNDASQCDNQDITIGIATTICACVMFIAGIVIKFLHVKYISSQPQAPPPTQYSRKTSHELKLHVMDDYPDPIPFNSETKPLRLRSIDGTSLKFKYS